MKKLAGAVLFVLVSPILVRGQTMQADAQWYKDRLLVRVEDGNKRLLPGADVTVSTQNPDPNSRILKTNRGDGTVEFSGLTPVHGQVTVTARMGSLESDRRTLKWVLRDGTEIGEWTAEIYPLSGCEGRLQSSIQPACTQSSYCCSAPYVTTVSYSYTAYAPQPAYSTTCTSYPTTYSVGYAPPSASPLPCITRSHIRGGETAQTTDGLRWQESIWAQTLEALSKWFPSHQTNGSSQ